MMALFAYLCSQHEPQGKARELKVWSQQQVVKEPFTLWYIVLSTWSLIFPAILSKLFVE
jgi:hypothetical protein